MVLTVSNVSSDVPSDVEGVRIACIIIDRMGVARTAMVLSRRFLG